MGNGVYTNGFGKVEAASGEFAFRMADAGTAIALDGVKADFLANDCLILALRYGREWVRFMWVHLFSQTFGHVFFIVSHPPLPRILLRSSQHTQVRRTLPAFLGS